METVVINEYKFPLLDVVKYAKGHYNRTDSIWYDMALCLWDNGQGYGPYFGYSEHSTRTPQEECFRERANICENIIGKIRPLLVGKEYRLNELTRHTSPQESWKVGYYTKQSQYPFRDDQELPDWEYWEAVLRAHLSELCHMAYYELGYENWDEFNGRTIPELQKD